MKRKIKILKQMSLILFSCMFFHVMYAAGEKTFTGRVVSAETGLPLAATVSVTNSQGLAIGIDGEHQHVFYLGKKRWYINGTFSVTTTEDSLFVEVRHGLETYPLNDTIYMSGSVSKVKEFKLRRWTNMTNKGYYSGDTHVHFLETKSAHKQMQAEDLHVVNLLTSDFTYDREKFTGALDSVSTHEHFVYVGQEIRDWQLGHANFLDLKNIVEPYTPFGGFLYIVGSNPNLLLSPRLQEAGDQDAAVVWAHFSNLPGLESVIAIPLGLIDAVELVTYDDPTRLPSHWAPWDYSDMSQAEFTVMRGMDLYYQYLNAGFMLPITAGTDKMGDDIPVGSNRHYVRLNGKANYDNWIESLKTGQGFITNSPMLNFDVEGHLSGETVIFEEEKTVKIKVKAESLLPFGRLEIVANGKVISWEVMPDYYEERGLYTLEMEKEITLSKSTWLAGRVTSVNTPKILPRNLTVFAHTNPLYFLKSDKPVHEKISIEYLKMYQKATRNWIDKYSDFSTESEREEALMYMEKAEQVLDKIDE